MVLEIATDGSIHPKEALKEAAKILIHHFMLFSDEKIAIETVDTDGNEEFDEEVLHMRQLLKSKLSALVKGRVKCDYKVVAAPKTPFNKKY